MISGDGPAPGASIALRSSRVRPRRSRKIFRTGPSTVVEVAPLCVSEERIELLNRFLTARYPEKNSCGREYYAGFFLNSMTDTLEFRYSLGGKLVGVGIVDCGASWLNAVYFYFDPDFSDLSPGTFNILTLIDHASRCGLESLYLGYWIDGLAAMSYKEKFKPYYLLLDGVWRRHDRIGRKDGTI